jgi:ATP-binding cassette subfamily D (ALD) long-chain fatty acid import protein
MYASAQELGITVITISHRYALSKYHTLLLKIGEGNGKEWALESISSSNTLIESVDNEVKKIKGSLGDEVALRKRLAVINLELGLDVEAAGDGGVKRTTI